MSTFYGASLPNSILNSKFSSKTSILFTKDLDSAFTPLSPQLALCASRDEATSECVSEAPKDGSLGIFTKSQSALENIRFERYSLQMEAKKLLPKQRVSKCLYCRIDSGQGVKILLNESRNKANYGNLIRCASIWHCPVCAAIISEKRKLEVKQALDAHRSALGAVYLLTLTNSHNASNSLKSLKLGQSKAMSYFFGDRKSKAYFEAMGKVGHINAYEVTHGANGWHPHHHILLFLEHPVDQGQLSQFREELARHWIDCCRKAKLPLPSMQHGLDLQDGTYADAYVSKWGLEHEVTKGHIKQGNQGGHTPWDLLRLSRAGDCQSGKLFQEFAISFKGARQLVWSRGLKALLLSTEEEKTDQQIVDETEKESKEVMTLIIEQWAAVRAQGKRADLLSAVEKDSSLVMAKQLITECVLAEIQRLEAEYSS